MWRERFGDVMGVRAPRVRSRPGRSQPSRWRGAGPDCQGLTATRELTRSGCRKSAGSCDRDRDIAEPPGKSPVDAGGTPAGYDLESSDIVACHDDHQSSSRRPNEPSGGKRTRPLAAAPDRGGGAARATTPSPERERATSLFGIVTRAVEPSAGARESPACTLWLAACPCLVVAASCGHHAASTGRSSVAGGWDARMVSTHLSSPARVVLVFVALVSCAAWAAVGAGCGDGVASVRWFGARRQCRLG
jgi:hypothetical protein